MSFYLYNPRDTTYDFLELTWTKSMIVARIFLSPRRDISVAT